MSSEGITWDGSSPGEPFVIPGADRPVSMLSLHTEPSRAFSLFVTFPENWDRPTSGSYRVAEDVVFLTGLLQIGDHNYGPGDWAHMPAGFYREHMHADSQVVALARFDGPARWDPDEGDRDATVTRGRIQDGRKTDSPLPDCVAYSLFESDPAYWMLESVNGGTSEFECQVLDINSKTWYHVVAGGPLPTIPTPALAWVFGVET